MSEARLDTAAQRLQTRNQELGTLLETARLQQRRSISECAALLGTSRRRYTDIERGRTGIHVAELEVMMHFLGIPQQQVWPDSPPHEQAVTTPVVVQARPGERLQFVVEVRG
jgi:transcriptional regulator with XRE-family HTH domain